jgi:hypothetical protein
MIPPTPCLITVDLRVYRVSPTLKAQTEVQSSVATASSRIRIDLELQTEPYLQEVVEKPEVIDRNTDRHVP